MQMHHLPNTDLSQCLKDVHWVYQEKCKMHPSSNTKLRHRNQAGVHSGQTRQSRQQENRAEMCRRLCKSKTVGSTHFSLTLHTMDTIWTFAATQLLTHSLSGIWLHAALLRGGIPGGTVGSVTDRHRLRAASSLPRWSRTHSTDRVVAFQRLAAMSSMFLRGQPGWSGLFDGSAMHSHTWHPCCLTCT